MRRIHSLLLGGAIGASLVLAASGGASAHDNGHGEAPNHYAGDSHVSGSAVDGGDWYYGVHEMINGSDRNVDSSYFHASRVHRASVKSSGVVTRSQDHRPGVWAQATRPAAPSGNQSYWYAY